MADAPLAMLAFLAFASAERSRSRVGYLVAGLACGACWWIKPTVAVPLYLAMALYIVVARRLDVRWLHTALGCALMIGTDLVFLNAVSNDPFSTFKALLPFLDSHRQYHGDPMWGSNSPWLYFRRMFLDGREMWLVPFVAMAGAATLAHRLATARRPAAAAATATADRFVLFWAATLIGIFSFFVFSLHPVRFIPKQENYASLFLAPLALLAAVALMRLPVAARVALAVVLAAGGLALAGIEQQGHRQKYSRMAQALEFARAQPDATVLVSAQTATAGRMREITRQGARAPGLEGLAEVDRFVGADTTEASKALFIVLEPSSPERSDSVLWPKIAALARCAQPVRELPAESAGAGVAALRLADWLRQNLPSAVGRQIGFVEPLLHPLAASVLAVPAACRASVAPGPR